MQFVYSYIVNKNNRKLLHKLNNAADRLCDKLLRIDIDMLDISDYNKFYLKKICCNVKYFFNIYTFILYHALKNNEKELDEIVVVDYGGGTGLLSFLAYESGIRNIIYVDIYKKSINDSQIIAGQLACKCRTYLHGDIQDLKYYMKNNDIKTDALVSSDVIEHVYNLEDFMRIAGEISGKQTNLIFSTSANIKNPVIRQKLKKLHYTDEYTDREAVAGNKQCDTLYAHYNLRLKIINDYAGDKISEKTKQLLAKLTRGKIKEDIEFAVHTYIKEKKIPLPPVHKTNTCDPFSGNWSERLVEHKYYRKLAADNGLLLRVMPGFYGVNPDEFIFKKLIKFALNHIIKAGGRNGVYIAPYIILSISKNK